MAKTKFIAALAFAGIMGTGAASAADLAARPAYTKAPAMVAVYNWTGFYIGVHGGYGWGTSDWVALPVNVPPQGGHKIAGGLVGGQVGYNWQSGPLVLGIEGEGSWADINGSHLDPTATLLATKIKALGSVSGRIGYAINNVLLYAKGGAAFASVDYRDSFGVLLNGAGSFTRTGYLVGAGMEYGFTPNWTAKIEYNYMDFGANTVTLNGGIVVGGFQERITDRLHVVKGGLNYKF